MIGAIVVGLLIRLLLVLVSHGSNDMATWADFANRIGTYGLLDTYRSMPLFNHPPLMGWYAALCQLFANGTGIPFAWCFKAPVVLGDALAMWLVARHWGAKRGMWAGLVAAAVYGLNPVAVLITSYHGNTDSLCAIFGLCAVILHQRGRYAWAGLLLGAAINVKIIAVLWVPGLLLLCSSWRQALAFLLTLSAAGLPFLVPLLGSYEAFVRNALKYNSLVDSWGVNFIPLFYREQFPELSRLILEDYRSNGRYVILSGVALFAVLGRWKRWDSATAATVPLAFFLIATPGFGIQYLMWVVPVMAAASTAWSACWALTAGSFAFWVYVAFLISPYPLESSHFTIARPLGMWGIVPWALLVVYVMNTAFGLSERVRFRRLVARAVARVRDGARATAARARALSPRGRAMVGGALMLTAVVAFAAVTESTRLRLRQDKATKAPWVASSTFMAACTSPDKRCASSPHFFFHTRLDASPWIKLDLGSRQEFSSVYIVNRNDCCRKRATPLVVEVGDGQTWTVVARTRRAFTSWWPSFAPVTARYVRIRVEGSSYLHLQDIKVL